MDEGSQQLAERMAGLDLEGLGAINREEWDEESWGSESGFNSSDDETEGSGVAKLNLQHSREMKCKESLLALTENKLEAKQQRSAREAALEAAKLAQELEADESESEGEREEERGLVRCTEMAERQRIEDELVYGKWTPEQDQQWSKDIAKYKNDFLRPYRYNWDGVHRNFHLHQVLASHPASNSSCLESNDEIPTRIPAARPSSEPRTGRTMQSGSHANAKIPRTGRSTNTR